VINCVWLVLYKASKVELRSLLIKPAAEDKRRELISWHTNYLELHRVISSLGFPQLYHISLGLFAKVKASFLFVRGYYESRKSCLKILVAIQ